MTSQRKGSSGFILPAYLVLGVLLGGSSSGGAAANMLLQLIGVGIIWWQSGQPDTFERRPFAARRELRWLLWLTGGWIILQLVPLPGGLWAALPGHAQVAEAMGTLGNTVGWRPLAIEWERAIGSALGFIPPLAVLILALRASRQTIARSAIALIAATVLSSLVGAMQLAGGTGSSLYFYTLTTTSASTGFFANSNHFSTLFNICAALALAATEPARPRKKGDEGSLAWLGWLALAIFFLANTFLNRSLAGLALGLLVAAYGALFFIGRIGSPAKRMGALTMLAIGAIAAAGLVLFAPRSVTERFFFQTTDSSSRLYLWDRTLAAIGDTMPTGTGLGNFRWFFPLYEDPQAFLPSFANHAHNDWLEFTLEGGIFSVAILGLLAWVLVKAWRAGVQGPWLAKTRLAAPYVAMLVIALHSMADYPLRTATISMAGAFVLAMALRGLSFDPERARQ